MLSGSENAMNVSKEDSPVEPSYPDAKEFLKHKAAISAAILSAGWRSVDVRAKMAIHLEDARVV